MKLAIGCIDDFGMKKVRQSEIAKRSLFWSGF